MSLLSLTPLFPIAAAHPSNGNIKSNLLISKPNNNNKPRFSLGPSILGRPFSLHSYFKELMPTDFTERWGNLVRASEEAEARLSGIPLHLVQATTASEDRRFFHHCGVDPYGIGRAVVWFPKGGGGSTITQQLARRIFLSSERKISRKFAEGLLSLMLEKRMSKRRILFSYLSKIYWGHGMYGIEAASQFYFGKHPNFLDVGESALLVGILPAPELLNPFKSPSRGKASQIRVLRRMVAAGFIDVNTALDIASRPLCLRTNSEANPV